MIKINSVSKKIFWGTFIAGWSASAICALNSLHSAIEKENQAKEIIKQGDIDRYNKLANQEEKNMFSVNWYQEASKVQDSLKMDSIAKTNYALGVQAVRDSISKTKLGTPQEQKTNPTLKSLPSSSSLNIKRKN